MSPGAGYHPPALSVVVPAHNEESTIERTLSRLLESATPGEFEVVVVGNACTDRTVELAQRFDDVRVLHIKEASKAAAVRVGNSAVSAFPRVHLDADVEISSDAVRTLSGALRGDVVAVAPRRVVPRADCSPLVRWYYDVWERLPQVESGLFGRGVFVVSRQAQQRLDALPSVMSDDLVVSDAFERRETRVLDDIEVVVRPPKRLSDLIRRRVRVATGTAQADQLGLRRSDSSTSVRTLLGMARRQPGVVARLPVFLGVTLAARFRARWAVRRGDFSTWQRDESSRH